MIASTDITSQSNSTMKVLLSAQQYLRVFGIYQPLHSNPFNFKNVSIWIGMILATVLLGIFLFSEAESLVEFGAPFYIFAVGLNLSIGFPINIWKIFDIVKLIKDIEKFIRKSKFHIIFIFSAFCVFNKLIQCSRIGRLFKSYL